MSKTLEEYNSKMLENIRKCCGDSCFNFGDCSWKLTPEIAEAVVMELKKTEKTPEKEIDHEALLLDLRKCVDEGMAQPSRVSFHNPELHHGESLEEKLTYTKYVTNLYCKGKEGNCSDEFSIGWALQDLFETFHTDSAQGKIDGNWKSYFNTHFRRKKLGSSYEEKHRRFYREERSHRKLIYSGYTF